MVVSFRYWDDCVDPRDMQEMWMDPDVSAEWITAGETVGSKVHLSRDTDGQPYLTQNEMKAVAGIIVHRHFISEIDSMNINDGLDGRSTAYATNINSKNLKLEKANPKWLKFEEALSRYDGLMNSNCREQESCSIL